MTMSQQLKGHDLIIKHPNDAQRYFPSFLAKVLEVVNLRLIFRILSLILFVALWEFLALNKINLALVDFKNVPSPSEVIPALFTLIKSPKLFHHTTNSLYRVFAGFIAASVVGVCLGLIIGRSRLAYDTLMPPLETLRPIPGVAWIPLAILMFPSSELSMIFITFMGALFPILLNTIHGVENIDQRLTATARSLGASKARLLSEVILPGSAPSIVTGLSIGMGTSWFCLVTAEMIAGQYGIGYYTWESYNLQRYSDIVVGMVLIGLFGMGSSALVKKIGAVLTPWHELKTGRSHD